MGEPAAFGGSDDGDDEWVPGFRVPQEYRVLMHDSLEGDSIAPLLSRAARGDQDAWRSLVGTYGPRVFALARSRCHDADIAEEITQSVFATVAVKMTGGEYAERGRFESWLFRVAMNRVRDMIRRNKHRAETPGEGYLDNLVAPGGTGTAGSGTEAAGRDGTDARDDAAAMHALRRAMEELSPADREVIELRHHAQMGFKQMSEVLDEPLGTLLARHHRALRKLREIMERNNPTMAELGAKDREMKGWIGR